MDEHTAGQFSPAPFSLTARIIDSAPILRMGGPGDASPLAHRECMSRYRQLARDYECHARKAAAFVRLSMIRLMLRASRQAPDQHPNFPEQLLITMILDRFAPPSGLCFIKQLRHASVVRLCPRRVQMTAKGFFRRLRADEKGASLIEYSVLIGIILVLAIASVRGVGAWVNSQWTNLNTELNSN